MPLFRGGPDRRSRQAQSPSDGAARPRAHPAPSSGPLILAGEFTRDTAFAAICRLYIANPDLVDRFRLDHVPLPLKASDEATFQNGEEAGYIDYPFLETALVPAI